MRPWDGHLPRPRCVDEPARRRLRSRSRAGPGARCAGTARRLLRWPADDEHAGRWWRMIDGFDAEVGGRCIRNTPAVPALMVATIVPRTPGDAMDELREVTADELRTVEGGDDPVFDANGQILALGPVAVESPALSISRSSSTKRRTVRGKLELASTPQ